MSDPPGLTAFRLRTQRRRLSAP